MKLNASIRKRFRVSNKVKKVASSNRLRLCISRSTKNISAQIVDDSKNVTFLMSSIIWAEIFLDDLEILNLNLSLGATFLTLLLTLNRFLLAVSNFIIFSFPLF